MKRLVLVLGVFFLLTAQACPDFTKDSEDGAIPRNLPASDFSASTNRTTSFPAPITCNHELTFQSDQSESLGAGGCAGYNFAALFNRADSLAAAQARSTTCPPGPTCPALIPWRSYYKWDCGGNRATASVQWKADCTPGPAPAGAWLAPPPPTPGDLAQPNPGGTGTANLSDQTLRETFFPGTVGCTPPQVVRFEYNEEVTPRPASLQAYVQRAEQLAGIFHTSLNCAAVCTKQPYAAVHREWSWANNQVTVVIHFVPCL